MTSENKDKLMYHVSSSKLMELFEIPDRKYFNYLMDCDLPENFVIIRHLDREKGQIDDKSLTFLDDTGKILHETGCAICDFYHCFIALLKLLKNQEK